jgi:hypothetical protein
MVVPSQELTKSEKYFSVSIIIGQLQAFFSEESFTAIFT